MSQLAIFTAPKAFSDPHINLIQRNALRSWKQMGSDVEIILVGDEEGLAETAEEFSLTHLPKVEVNQHGTPLVSSIFELARAASDALLLAYVNADIILFPETLDLALELAEQESEFLLLGQRHDLDIHRALEFSPGWSQDLRKEVHQRGRLHPPGGSDYFIFPQHLYKDIPDFAIGRAGWDNWIIYHAVSQPWPAINMTPSLMVVHQDHDYTHLPQGKAHYKVEETYRNTALAGGMRHIYSLLDVEHIYVDGAVQPAGLSLARLLRNLERWLQPDERVGRGLRWFLLRRVRRLRRAIVGAEEG